MGKIGWFGRIIESQGGAPGDRRTMHGYLPWAAAGACLLIGLVAVLRMPRALVSWCFLGGMVGLAVERVVDHKMLAMVGGAGADVWAARALLRRIPGAALLA